MSSTLPPRIQTLADSACLQIGNPLIQRVFQREQGQWTTRSIGAPDAMNAWNNSSLTPDLNLPPPGSTAPGCEPTDVWQENGNQTIFAWRLGELELRRVFTVYDDCPAIISELHLRGRTPAATWRQWTEGERPTAEAMPVLDCLPFGRAHVELEVARFYDCTDAYDNLVETTTMTPGARLEIRRGNVAWGRNILTGDGFFVLKLSPCGAMQQADAGGDFLINRDGVRVIGLGVEPGDLDDQRWTCSYRVAIGVCRGDAWSRRRALRRVQQCVQNYDGGRDFQMVVNTWGGGNGDSRVNEAFCLAEVDATAKLGLTHFMIDDGWQHGASVNSRVKPRGSFEQIWDPTPDFWNVDRSRFPRGLEPIVQRASERGVKLGLWYVPARAGDYRHWRRDADRLLDMHRTHGIDLFKIDMVDLASKRAETNFRAMLDYLKHASDNRICLNLDVTAMRRGGYHDFNQYGPLFVENRYAHHASYYPHWTLRSLWQLSHFVDPRTLQMEFLDPSKHADRYPEGDPLAPANVPFAYSFAATLVAQPLAWLEASNLPASEAAALTPWVRIYKQHEAALHAGWAFGVGQTPTGGGWTGFQCANDPAAGYLLIFRECNDQPSHPVQLWGLHDVELSAQALMGDAADFTRRVDRDGRLTIALPAPLTFGLWRYRVQA